MTSTDKREYLNRPLKKLYPLELWVGNVNDKRGEVKDIEDVKGMNENQKRVENSEQIRNPWEERAM